MTHGSHIRGQQKQKRQTAHPSAESWVVVEVRVVTEVWQWGHVRWTGSSLRAGVATNWWLTEGEVVLPMLGWPDLPRGPGRPE